MRVYTIHENALAVTISKADSYRWAHRPGRAWPCATIRRSIRVHLDGNGDLVDVQPNLDCDVRELTAMLGDLLQDASGQRWRVKAEREQLARYAESQRSRV